jgi:cyclopropane-fatty-acyl-phospholipid synthase
MIYKFKSKATSDLIMLQANGESMLKLIKKGDASQLRQGILLAEDMPQAIASLQAAVELEERLRAEQVRLAQEEGRLPPAAPAVSLRQRSAPFIQMLQRCMAANEEVVWGV